MPFTQQQLEDAYKQMADDRAADKARAEAAAKWVGQQVGANCHVRLSPFSHPGGWWPAPVTPYPTPYQLVLVYETYGPHLADLTNFLNGCGWAAVVQATPAANPEYTATTPSGKYPVKFEYFDNHCTGY